MNEKIYETMRLVSNAIIVLTSREMLIQLITMTATLHQAGLALTTAVHIPPPIQATSYISRGASPHQYEFELLQILDILYHTTDSVSTYKRVVRALLSSSSSSSSSWSRLILSRMACASVMPEFRLVKRESWSSDEKRSERGDRGRVDRVRSTSAKMGNGNANGGGGLCEDAIQFEASSTTNANVNAVVTDFYNSISSILQRFHQQPTTTAHNSDSTAERGGGGGGVAKFEAGCKPNDIERLTNPDSSNLLLIFDPNTSNKSSNNKQFTVNIDFFKR